MNRATKNRDPSVGRPTIRTKEAADGICERIASGESLSQITSDSRMPSKRAILDWLGDDGEFLHQYSIAKEQQAEHYADELVDIADSTKGAKSSVEVQSAKLRIGTRLARMAILAPKKYGKENSRDQQPSRPDGLPAGVLEFIVQRAAEQQRDSASTLMLA